jgi:hypothetical protein
MLKVKRVNKVDKEGAAAKKESIIKDLVEMSKTEARKALCNTLIYHLNSIVNLIFG